MTTSFLDFLKKQDCLVIAPSIDKTAYCSLDLSHNNPDLKEVNVSKSDDLERFVNSEIKKKNAQVAYGGYLEKRNIYQRSSYFKAESDLKNERNIHLGIDIWAAEGTSVQAALAGTIHSYKNNLNHGDYGPTIILEHDLEGFKFYTLYGHLSKSSIKNISIGQSVEKAEQIATLGSAEVNGDYPPHLHFQLIINLENKRGDYPGVCSENELEFYKTNCPDPSLILGL